MLHTTLPVANQTARRKRRLPSFRFLMIALCTLFALAATTTWLATRTRIVDLGNDNQMLKQGVYESWANGAVIVLIRHAERCDRSHAACLSDPVGITLDGSQAAADVGAGMQRLGMTKSDVLSSPEVRTRQTAHFMFGEAVATQDWLNQCNRGFSNNAFSHKRTGHNLVLVTHSGCIDHVERQLNVPGGERTSAYASALFISMGNDGKAHILGQMNASEWHKLLANTGE